MKPHEINNQIFDAISEVLPLKPCLESFTVECKVGEWPKITQTYYADEYLGATSLKTQEKIFNPNPNPNRTLEEVAKDIVEFGGELPVEEELYGLIGELEEALKGN